MKKTSAALLMIVLCGVGALAGWFAAPLLARTHSLVRLADQVKLELAKPGTKPTLQSDSFRTSGLEPAALFDQADDVRRSFAIGAPILGAWCGLAFGIAILAIARGRESRIYEIDYDICVSCGRCFTYCPREQLRLRRLAQPKVPTPSTGAKA